MDVKPLELTPADCAYLAARDALLAREQARLRRLADIPVEVMLGRIQQEPPPSKEDNVSCDDSRN